MNKTERINFSFSIDLASQNKLLKDPGQVYIAKTINIGHRSILGRYWVGLGSVWSQFGVGLGSLWGQFGVGSGSIW